MKPDEIQRKYEQDIASGEIKHLGSFKLPPELAKLMNCKPNETELRDYESLVSEKLTAYYRGEYSKGFEYLERYQRYYHRWYYFRKFLWENTFFHRKNEWSEPYHKVEFTFSGVWSSKKKKWIKTLTKKPNWRISLPWKKKTRAFPKITDIQQGSDELFYGIDLQSVIISTLEPLMKQADQTTIHVTMKNESNKVTIYTV